MSTTLYDFTRQDRSGASCTAQAWAQVPPPLPAAERRTLKVRAADLLRQRFNKACERLGYERERRALDVSLFRPAALRAQQELF